MKKYDAILNLIAKASTEQQMFEALKGQWVKIETGSGRQYNAIITNTVGDLLFLRKIEEAIGASRETKWPAIINWRIDLKKIILAPNLI